MKQKLFISLAILIWFSTWIMGIGFADNSQMEFNSQHIVFSDRYKKIKLAEDSIRTKYMITPDMYTFFIRNVTDSDDGKVTVTLTGANEFSIVLGTYSATSDGVVASATWSNDGFQTYGGFDAPAWDALQLHQLIEMIKNDEGIEIVYQKAKEIAKEHGVDFSDFAEYPSLLDEHDFELTADHPNHTTIEERSKLSVNQMNALAINVVKKTYNYNDTAMITVVESEPDLRFYMEGDRLLYRAWLCFSDDSDLSGQFVVVIDAETGVVEDMIYDSKLGAVG